MGALSKKTSCFEDQYTHPKYNAQVMSRRFLIEKLSRKKKANRRTRRRGTRHGTHKAQARKTTNVPAPGCQTQGTKRGKRGKRERGKRERKGEGQKRRDEGSAEREEDLKTGKDTSSDE